MIRKFLNSFIGILVFVLFLSATFGAGYYVAKYNETSAASVVSFSNFKSMGTAPEGVDFGVFWDAWSILEDRFVPSGTTTLPTNDEKVWNAIRGLTEAYNDPYTSFFEPEDLKSFEEDIHGTFEGVGMELELRDGILTVVSPFKDTPAYKAGIKAGDRILEINGVSTEGITIAEGVKNIKGPRGTKVTLTILSIGEVSPRKIDVVRDVIKIPTVETEKTKDGVFIVRLMNFSSQAPSQFRTALREFASAKTDKLILDLRNNPGGYLESAVDIASWFLPVGKTIVLEDFGEGKPQEHKRSKGYDAFTDDLKMVILINEGSASASEILAGALSELGKAKLVGVPTFGKGSVQELIPLEGNTSIKVTIARWLTPNGKSISDGGVKPDYEVKDIVQKTGEEIDEQLDKAIEVLNKM